MRNRTRNVPELEFSRKYRDKHARAYYHKHTDGFWRKLSNWREIRIARKALKLAGNPRTILDLPSGTGRFWPMLTEDDARKLYAADSSQSMLDVALEKHPQPESRCIETFLASAFDIPRPDNFVECLFSMRLLHHVGEREHRMKILPEFHRVTSATVVVSLWMDGNYKAHRRARLERRRHSESFQNRFVQTRDEIETEIREAGFEIVGHVDFLKYFAMWRIYILRKR